LVEPKDGLEMPRLRTCMCEEKLGCARSINESASNIVTELRRDGVGREIVPHKAERRRRNGVNGTEIVQHGCGRSPGALVGLGQPFGAILQIPPSLERTEKRKKKIPPLHDEWTASKATRHTT